MIAGNDSSLPFSLVLSIRTTLLSSRSSALVTLGAIATSVTMAVGVEVSARSARSELTRTAAAIAGVAALEVSAGGIGVPEGLLDEVRGVAGVFAAAPLVEWTVRISEGELMGRPVHVIGVDLMLDRSVRHYSIDDGAVEVTDPLRLFSELGAVIVAEELLDETGFGLRDRIHVHSEAGESELRVMGILRAGGIADAFAGQLAVMDIYAVQELTGRRGWFDRIDIVAEPGGDVADLRERLSRLLEGRATVRRSHRRGEYAERAFETIEVAIWFMASIGVLVAAFVTFSAVSRRADARTSDFAALQLVGLERWRMRRLVIADTCLMGVAGTLIGTLGGMVFAPYLVSMFSRLSDLVEQTRVINVSFEATTAAAGVSAGLAVSILGCLPPLRNATTAPPLDVLKRRRRATGRESWSTRWLLLSMVLAVAAGVGVSGASPLIRLSAIYGGSLVAVAILAVPLVVLGAPRAGQAIAFLLPHLGPFSGSSLLARPVHAGLNIAALTGVVGGLVGIIVVLSSVGDTFHRWLSSRYPGGLIISAADPFAALFDDKLPPVVVKRIVETEGVEAALESFNTWTLYDGQEVLLIARSMDVMATHGQIPALDRDPREVAKMLKRGEVAVSEGFSRRFDVDVGKQVQLATPAGMRSFTVAALVRDFVGPSGSIHLGIETFDRFWPRNGAAAVVIWTSDSKTNLEDRIRGRVGQEQTLFVTRSDEYADYMNRIFERFAGLLYAVAGLTSVLGGIGVASLMAGSITDRERELAVLRCSGATSVQLAGIVFVDALLVVSAGSALGVALGLAGADPMLGVLEDSMGWMVERSVSLKAVATVLGASMIGGLAVSVLPAFLAVRIDPGAVVSQE